MLIGCHVSAAGGLHHAPENAAALGLETFQFFTRPPQVGQAALLKPSDVSNFRGACERLGFSRSYVHAPYVINLASTEKRIRENSIAILSDEIRRSDALGVTAMMTHLGSANKVKPNEAIDLVADGLRRILEGYEGEARFLVENSAGAGQVIGADFGQISAILEAVGDPRIGICLDTAHAFASGYDLRTPASVAETLRRFDQIIGLGRLAVMHMNDSVPGLGERKDRHAHLGQGQIGLGGFSAIVAAPPLKHVDLILETPDDEKRIDDIKLLKSLRDA